MTSQSELAEVVRSGRPILVPTDTVYGIAADPSNPEAVAEIFRLKGRPPEKALPVLASGIEALGSVALLDDRARAVAGCFWPGALTLVLPRAIAFDHDLGGDDDSTVAVRVPRSEPLRRLLELTGPLAVTSANRSGEDPATTLEEALSVFGDDTPALAAGETTTGEPSTVLSLLGAPEILRAGAITLAAVEECLRSAGLES